MDPLTKNAGANPANPAELAVIANVR